MGAEINPVPGSGKVNEEINHPNPDKKAQKLSDSIVNVALLVLEGIGLIFANIFTLGLINFLPGIHEAYKKVFGGKEVEIISSPVENHEEIQEPFAEVEDLSAESEENSNSHEVNEEDNEPSVKSEENSNTHEVVEENDKDPSVKDDPKEEPLPLGSQEEEPAPPQDNSKDKDQERDFQPGNTEHIPPPTSYFDPEMYGNAFGNIRDTATTAYQEANRKNAQFAWDQTKAGASWALGKTQSELKTAWDGCTKENAQKAGADTLESLGKIGRFAMRPENRCRAIAATTTLAAVGVVIVGLGLSGGNPENEFNHTNETLQV